MCIYGQSGTACIPTVQSEQMTNSSYSHIYVHINLKIHFLSYLLFNTTLPNLRSLCTMFFCKKKCKKSLHVISYSKIKNTSDIIQF